MLTANDDRRPLDACIGFEALPTFSSARRVAGEGQAAASVQRDHYHEDRHLAGPNNKHRRKPLAPTVQPVAFRTKRYEFWSVRKSGGDTDATFRPARALYPLLRKDRSQWNIYERIHVPAIMAFANRVERFGMVVDQDALRKLSSDVKAWLNAEYRALIRMVPAAVRRKHLEAGLRFSRDLFVRDALFSKEGFNLTPKVFTKSTEDLADDKKVPSVSTKDHMPYFVTRKDAAGIFVNRLIEYQKTAKMDSTYCGDEAEGTGFWQYLSPDSRIFPSFALHKTNTGRTASSDPNGQNYPKRGQWAKPFLKIFRPNPGYRFVAADLSQIELRIAAWEANDPTMMGIYLNDGDIHMMTAAATMRLSVEEFRQQLADVRKFKRFAAKAVSRYLCNMLQPKLVDLTTSIQYWVSASSKETDNEK